MSKASEYRVKAAAFAAMAEAEMHPGLQSEYARMAAGYRRLAEMADQNSYTDVVYETSPITRGGEG